MTQHLTTYSWCYFNKHSRSPAHSSRSIDRHLTAAEALRAAEKVIRSCPIDGRLQLRSGLDGWAHLNTVATWRIHFMHDGIAERLAVNLMGDVCRGNSPEFDRL